MRWGSRAAKINAWWEGAPGERYWLDVTHRNDRDKLLAAPRGEGTDSVSWAHELIAHVNDGDVVFHYDAMEQAIVACSIAHGAVEKVHLSWPLPMESPGVMVTSRILASRAIRLRQATKLKAPVSLGEIACTQWSLFPSLRALEDKFGDPLYYPFDVGNKEVTRLLSGYVFKLPAVFVQGFPELARAADYTAQLLEATGGVAVRVDLPGASSPRGRAIERGGPRESHQWRPGRGGTLDETDQVLQGTG